MSFDYYSQYAQKFFTETFEVNMSKIYTRFLTDLSPGCSILDMGCGSGRDALYFYKKGYSVDAFDASLEMVKLATQATGLNIKHNTFHSYNVVSSFDGIWACASLLHLPKSEHEKIIAKFYEVLNPSGNFYMSFKYGTKDYDKDGRHFSCYDAASVAGLLDRLLLNCKKEIWISEDVRKERQGECWLNVLLTKYEH